MERSARVLVALVGLVALTGCTATPDGDGDGDGGATSDSARPSTATTPASAGLRYVALGDSFTSAPGVGATTGPGVCFRTDLNYPHLLAERLDLELVDVSCAGATSRDLRRPQAGAGDDVRAQLDALTPDTELVTLSIGANDAGLFGALAVQCTSLGAGQGVPCSSDRRFADDRLAGELSALAQETRRSVRAIRKRSPDAEVVVIGYPQLVTRTGTCDVLPIAAADVPFVWEVNRRLAAAVERGARVADAEYVDMWAASRGHDACAEQPWIAGLRPVGPGAPLHPYPAHQEAVADALAALVG